MGVFKFLIIIEPEAQPYYNIRIVIPNSLEFIRAGLSKIRFAKMNATSGTLFSYTDSLSFISSFYRFNIF